MSEVNWLAVGVIAGPVFPSAHERVLEYGQLVGVVARVVEESVDESLRDASAADGDGARDRLGSLVARHARDEVLPLVDGFGQAPELRAVAEEVGAHGEYDVDRVLALARGL